MEGVEIFIKKKIIKKIINGGWKVNKGGNLINIFNERKELTKNCAPSRGWRLIPAARLRSPLTQRLRSSLRLKIFERKIWDYKFKNFKNIKI